MGRFLRRTIPSPWNHSRRNCFVAPSGVLVHECGENPMAKFPSADTKIAVEVRNGCSKDQLCEKIQLARQDSLPLLYEISWYSVSRGSASPDDLIQLLSSGRDSLADLPPLLCVYVPCDSAESARLDPAYKSIPWPSKFPPERALSKEKTPTGGAIYEFELRNDKGSEVAKVLIEDVSRDALLKPLWMDVLPSPSKKT